MGEKEIEEKERGGGKKMNASVLSQDKSSLELNRKLILIRQYNTSITVYNPNPGCRVYN